MSCSINRYKNCGSSTPRRPETESAKAMDARLAEMMAIRSAQDRGDFKKVSGPEKAGVDSSVAATNPEPQAAGSTTSASWGSLHTS